MIDLEQVKRRVLAKWADAEMEHWSDGACAVATYESGKREYIGWGQVTAQRDVIRAEAQAWLDCAHRLDEQECSTGGSSGKHSS